MKILSWNIHKKNRNIVRAIDFLQEQDADIICLQEFPARHMGLLKDMGFYVAACEEVLAHYNKRKPTSRMYSVILSRFPIAQSITVAHKKRYSPHTQDAYAYFRADSLYIDVHTPQGLFRIFNTHFKCLAGPHHRLSQFSEVIRHLSRTHHNVICGDFNSFARPWLNIFLWRWWGFRIREFPINEGKILTELIEVHGLKNPLEGQVTFSKFPVQLDYILVPSHVEVKEKRAFLRLYGSDHFPLLLEI